MNLLRSLLIWLMLLLAAGVPPSAIAAEASGQGDWISYRDAYRTMLWFEKYGQPKHLITAHFRVQGMTSTPLPGQLTLTGKSVRLNLPMDETGRTSLPLLKLAYDENAELHLPQKMPHWRVGAEITIAIRADGIYELGELRAACQQVLAYQNWRDASLLRGKQCRGVRFVYATKSAPSALALRQAEPALPSLPLIDGAAFWQAGEAPVFRVANVLFGSLPDKAQILTPGAPLVISALFE